MTKRIGSMPFTTPAPEPTALTAPPAIAPSADISASLDHAVPVPVTSPGLEAAATLAGQVAHDLGNLLTILLGNAELLATRPDTPPDLADIVGRMMRTAQRGSLLADRLSLFARAAAPQAPPVEAAPLLAAHAARVAAGLPAGITLRAAIPGTLGPIALAPALLELALDELVANAVATLGDGGILRMSAAYAKAEAVLRIEIADNGAGMPAEMLRRAAGPAFAAGVAAHRTGLGMAIASRIAAAAGGRLLLASSPGAGTRAMLEFPAL